MKKRIYTKEFKVQAVRLSYQRKNIKELANELGLDPQRIYKWRKATKSINTSTSKKILRKDILVVKRLRKAIKDKEIELEILNKSRSHFLKERLEVYQFIASYRHLYPVVKMCKILKVSRSSYYRWFSQGPSKRALSHSLFTDLIKKEFNKSKQRYGSTRVAEQLKRKNYCISRRRVAKIMRENNWVSKHKKKFKITTDSNHKYSVCRNLLDRNFNPSKLNEVWVSDITYIETGKGWLYLTTIMDLYDRQIIGWSLSRRLYTSQTIIPAWKMATSKRAVKEKLLFHSDRGIQYACKAFRMLLKSNPLISQSMSRKGNCWDNAVAESFFKTLKIELIYEDEFKTIEQAKTSIFEYIEIWYNKKRLHSSLGYKTPYEVEQEFYQFKYVA